MPPFRVLVVSWEYPPVVEGGLARHVRKLCEALVAQGVSVHVLTRGGGRLPVEEERHGVRVHRVPEPEYPRDDIPAFVRWVRAMNADLRAAGRVLLDLHDFDLIHSHDWLVAAAGERLARDSGRPWVATVHATEHGRHQGRVQRYPQSHIHAAERAMVHCADRVIVCSAFMSGHVADAFGIGEERLAVIPNGIDPADLHPASGLARRRARLAAPQERLVLMAGRLVWEKGFHVALDALPRVRARVPGVRWAVAGSGPAQPELEAQARRLRLDAHGRFLGWVGDDELHALYRLADLCVVPSLFEPFGLVALEAMASGCPCVVADTGGLREVVPGRGRVGLRFRAGDPAALARAIERVLVEDGLRDRLVARAGEHVLRFDWADAARQTGALYAELAGAVRALP